MESSIKDVDTRIAKGWAAINKLKIIWKSNLPKTLKRNFFRATVESILLYGATTWTLTNKMEKGLDGTYTSMLTAALNIDWRQHPTIKQFYGNLPRISNSLRERRLGLAGHLWRNQNELASDVLLWKPTHGKSSVERQAKTFIDQLSDDTGCCNEDLSTLMEDRDKWKSIITKKFEKIPQDDDDDDDV